MRKEITSRFPPRIGAVPWGHASRVHRFIGGATPTGLCKPAQGCRTRLPWETNQVRRPNPNGVVTRLKVTTPSGLETNYAIPKVAEYGNLGLSYTTPLGLFAATSRCGNKAVRRQVTTLQISRLTLGAVAPHKRARLSPSAGLPQKKSGPKTAPLLKGGCRPPPELSSL